MQVLSAEPTEYSYFSTNILRSWAGPEHWKVKAKTKDKGNNSLGLFVGTYNPNLHYHILKIINTICNIFINIITHFCYYLTSCAIGLCTISELYAGL